MSFTITDTCIGCTACTNVCPTEAITGNRKEMHVIDPQLCIDCGACTRVCPVECIHDPDGYFPPRIQRRQDWPKPVVDPNLCSGCSFCVDICPFDCLELSDDGEMFGISLLVDEKKCVACGECQEVCIKGAIVVKPVEEIGAA